MQKKLKAKSPARLNDISRSGRQQLTAGILVSGSLVYDTIFDLRGKMREQIVLKDGKLGNQNLMFTGREKQVYFGGTAGNIAYGLGKLGLAPKVVSVVGKDFHFYEEHLKNLGVNLCPKRDEEGFCSTFYAMTDENNEQIGIYQGGCSDKHLTSLSLLDCLSKKEIENVDVAIFSAGVAKSIVKQIEEFRKITRKNSRGTLARNKPYFPIVIFDPGQMLAIDFTPALLKRALRGANIAIVNEAEFNTLTHKHGLDLENIFALGVNALIVTKGGDGSVLYEMKDKMLHTTNVGAIRIKKVVDPTGAGDAYRAGLISALIKGKSIIDGMKLGAKLGAKCVQTKGGQNY